MKRRTMMLLAGAAGAMALAGCTSNMGATSTPAERQAAINQGVDATLATLYTSVVGSKELVGKAREIYASLQRCWPCQYDQTGAIGRRYRRQDEIGTPFCITVDFDSLNDNTVTLRERDSMKQERIAVSEIIPRLHEAIG